MRDTLIISDLHFPYNHEDAFDFIEQAKHVYSLDYAMCTGDVVDNHAGSFHDSEYGTLSSKEEFDQTYESMQRLSKIYPKMDIVIGNHDAIPARKAKSAGLPQDTIKDYNDLYGVNWNWKDKHFFNVKDKEDKCLLVHTMSTNTLNNAKSHSFNSIQGHHHSSFGIEYFADEGQLRWSLTAACLIDLKHPAFNYASGATMKRPIIGMAAIIDNEPRLLPMNLKANGRWDGVV